MLHAMLGSCNFHRHQKRSAKIHSAARAVQELLQACGRAHTLADVHAAIDAMHTAAPPSWSLDLITGLPGLTEENWRHSVECAIAAQPPHVSVYDLQVCDVRASVRSQK